ncbi:MAG: two-component system sensor histidine kinase NtrB [Burkholderiales bacterium]
MPTGNTADIESAGRAGPMSSALPGAARAYVIDRRQYGDAYWRSLFFFNTYRVFAALVLLGAELALGDHLPFGSYSRTEFLYTSVAYLFFGLLAFVGIIPRKPHFTLQLTVHIGADIAFVVLMMHSSGGVQSGLGLLLLVSLAAVGLVSRGKRTLFFAALATLAVLAEQAYEVLVLYGAVAQFAQAGMLSIGYFATGWLAHSLAKRAVAIEAIVAQREVDLANLAQVNQLVIQDMQDGVLVIDEGGAIRQINTRAEELLGPLRLGPREVDLRDYAPALWARLENWRREPNLAAEPLRAAGSNVPMSARFVPVGKARNVGMVIFLEDLTRVQQQAQQLKLASLGRLTANIAHEIRNPLSAINHATELLIEESASHQPPNSRMLQIIHDNARRLDRMVQDVLKLNRRDQALRERFVLAEYLDTFVQEFCEVEKIDPNTIQFAAAASHEVAFDRSHLNQVMWNLCRNSLRYCRKSPGSIELRVVEGPRRGTIELSVQDDGPGVAESLRGNLFEPFFTTASSGTGLGLYIAREICEANGATLEYVDTGGGACFRLICKGA